MARFAIAAALVLTAACSTPPMKATVDRPLTQTCADIAKLFENGSRLQPVEKRQALEGLKEQVFHWKVRVLAVSDETSRGELANGMAFDVECQDRPGTTDETGMRYVFTLYFEKRVPELAKLSRGAMLTVDGNLTSYEGQGGFAAHVKAYSID